MSSFFEELKRRNVFRVGLAYVITAWILAQVADLALDNFGAPAWVMKSLLLLLLIGFPLALIFAWAFEKTPDGIVLEKHVDRSRSITPVTGKKMDRGIIVALAIAVIFLLYKINVTDTPNAGTTEQTAADTQLPAGSGQDTTASEKSVAVLPFVNMSSDPEQDYFSDGIAEEILNVLAQVPGLQVAARTSAFQFKGKNQDIQDIARQLGVAWVLEGSVRKAGDRVRVTAQLIKAEKGFHAWSETYDRELNDIFAIQDEISQSISNALKVQLKLGEGPASAAAGSTTNVEAYEAYLMGRHLINQRTPDSIKAGLEQFKRATDLDPDYALAYADQAVSILLLRSGVSSYGDLPFSVALDMARPLVEKALALAPDRPEVLAAKGFLEVSAGNTELALDNYDRALAINPANGELQNWRRMALEAAGRLDQLLDASSDSVKYDPLSLIALYNHVFVLSWFGREEEARIMAQRLNSLDPFWGEQATAALFWIHGDLATAAVHLARALELSPGTVTVTNVMAAVLANVGLSRDAERLVPEDGSVRDLVLKDYESLARRSRAAIKDNPSDLESTQNLFTALNLGGRVREAVDAANSLWRIVNQRPAALIPDALVVMALAARESGDEGRAQEWRAAAGQSLQERDRVGMVGQIISGPHIARFFIAAYDKDLATLVSELDAAIDAGYRDRNFLGLELFVPFADKPGFRAQLDRLDAILAEQREQVLAMMCAPDAREHGWDPAPDTCVGQKTASLRVPANEFPVRRAQAP